MSTARHHAEWLSLLEISGPFLSMPVLLRAFPQGLDALDADLKRDVRVVYEEWLDNQGGLRADHAIHAAWARWVLQHVLEFPAEVLRVTDELDERFSVRVAEHGEVLVPDFAVVEPDDPGTARLLVQVVPAGQSLDKRLREARWSASPATRMMTLLHATGVRLGLVTNGEQWMLVDAPKDNTTGFVSWYAELWLDEEVTLRAFRSLLGVRRFFAVVEDETLEALLAASADDQQELTDQLGAQVRAAVEVLIQALDLADRDAGGALLAGLTPQALYEAALKVMMRLVFLLSAEERGLLPLEDPFYAQHYAVSTLRGQLREAADQSGEEVLERRHDAWSRLLATFRAVHGGIQHDRLTLPAYGGSLFDPDELPFLEGRPAGTLWRESPANPLPIDNRTVLHLLEALQVLQVRIPGGGPAEARRISFRALDIEQIGHVYEGLLDHTARRAAEPLLGLEGTKSRPDPIVALAELEKFISHEGGNSAKQKEEALAGVREDFSTLLQELTGRSASSLRRALEQGASPTEDTARFAQHVSRLRIACGNDAGLLNRVLPFAGLLREDSYGQPVLIPAGSFYVTAGATRRATGTHYTPRSLTEPIVQHTLEPLVYEGPAQGKPREQWRLQPPERILALKVCDMAMGSGAFLVQACRYLSERLVEAVELTSREGADTVKGKPREIPAPIAALREARDDEERLALARRLVTDRCLYGVDKNPLAVEMAKLSLWLITLDKGRPFTFLDHALKAGDSIVGVSLEQLLCWNLAGQGARKFETLGIQADIERMLALRRAIAATPVMDTRDQAAKRALLARADAIANHLKTGADLLVGAHYNTLSESDRAPLREALLRAFRDGADVPPELAAQADLGDPSTGSGQALQPFHWELEFPEVFGERGGFDAFVGNPPFIGGQRISGTFGAEYLQYLKTRWDHTRGSADYCAYFFLRAFELLRIGGAFGLIATNTIAQGDTRELGLAYIVEQGGVIYHAVNNQPWPGVAAVSVNVVHVCKGTYGESRYLDNRLVKQISPLLDTGSMETPFVLAANVRKSFQGSNILGLGFTMLPEEAQTLIVRDPRNAGVLFPYLNGEDLNSRPDQSPSRWVINFFDWPLEKAEQYPDCMAIVREKVYPERQRNKSKQRREMWWRFTRPTIELYDTIVSLKRVLVAVQTSKYLSISFQPKGLVYSHMTVVLALEDNCYFAVLCSSIHESWVRKYASTLETRLRYIPTDVFETFPFPLFADHASRTKLDALGETYHEHRRQLMLARQEGLTATYNRFHDPAETAADIARLRALHVEMDQAVAAAYGWDDLDLGHGFHETARGVRFTLSEPARWEVLDRLLALNHQRHAEEVSAQNAAQEAAGAAQKQRGKQKKTVAEEQGTLFEM